MIVGSQCAAHKTGLHPRCWWNTLYAFEWIHYIYITCILLLLYIKIYSQHTGDTMFWLVRLRSAFLTTLAIQPGAAWKIDVSTEPQGPWYQRVLSSFLLEWRAWRSQSVLCCINGKLFLQPSGYYPCIMRLGLNWVLQEQQICLLLHNTSWTRELWSWNMSYFLFLFFLSLGLSRSFSLFLKMHSIVQNT